VAFEALVSYFVHLGVPSLREGAVAAGGALVAQDQEELFFVSGTPQERKKALGIVHALSKRAYPHFYRERLLLFLSCCLALFLKPLFLNLSFRDFFSGLSLRRN